MKDKLHLTQLLEQGLKEQGIPNVSEPLLDYVYLLDKWNAAYNLTAIRDLESMIYKHILDSLAIIPWLRGTHLIDVGTGAGLPGIPIAIARPELHCVLLDSNGKKIRFLNEVKRQLNIKNIEAVQFRVENYQPTQGFDTVVTRAFSSLEQMMQWTQHLIADNGQWLAMKGRYPESELNRLNKTYHTHQYSVKGIEGERCCILIDNATKNC